MTDENYTQPTSPHDPGSIIEYRAGCRCPACRATYSAYCHRSAIDGAPRAATSAAMAAILDHLITYVAADFECLAGLDDVGGRTRARTAIRKLIATGKIARTGSRRMSEYVRVDRADVLAGRSAVPVRGVVAAVARSPVAPPPPAPTVAPPRIRAGEIFPPRPWGDHAAAMAALEPAYVYVPGASRRVDCPRCGGADFEHEPWCAGGVAPGPGA